MCISPVKILNPKLAWTPNDPKYLVVECGRCFECRARKQQEWFTRAYYEYKNNSKGSNFFATLTFRNEDLPFFEDKRDYQFVTRGSRVCKVDKKVNYSFQCFNSDYITTFIKLFRQNCKRMFPNQDTTGIKYFITSEYGEKKDRPHYHIDLFIPFQMKVTDFQNIITRSWTHGFVGASRNGGFNIQSPSALEYTAKYCCKDLYFYDKKIADYLDKDNLDSAEYEYRYDRVKNFLPRIRVSSGFGSSIVDEVNNSKDKIDFLLTNRPLCVPKKNGEVRNFALPRYIIQKLIKRVDKCFSKCLNRPYFVLTDLGRDYKRRLLQDKIDTDITWIRQLCSPLYLQSLKGKDKSEVAFLDNFRSSVSDIVNRLSIEKIAFYRNVMRYIPVDEYGNHTCDWYFRRKDLIVDNILNNTYPVELVTCFDVYTRELGYSLSDVGLRLSDIFPSRNGRSISECHPENILTLSQLGYFQVYERFAKLLDDIHFWSVRARSKRRKLKTDIKDFVRSAYADFVLYSNDGIVRQVV